MDINELFEALKAEGSQEDKADNLMELQGLIQHSLDEINEIKIENEKLKADKADLLAANSKLFNKIGIEAKPEEVKEVEAPAEDEEITVEDLLDI
jgi:hypothetical protein